MCSFAVLHNLFSINHYVLYHSSGLIVHHSIGLNFNVGHIYMPKPMSAARPIECHLCAHSSRVPGPLTYVITQDMGIFIVQLHL